MIKQRLKISFFEDVQKQLEKLSLNFFKLQSISIRAIRG